MLSLNTLWFVVLILNLVSKCENSLMISMRLLIQIQVDNMEVDICTSNTPTNLTALGTRSEHDDGEQVQASMTKDGFQRVSQMPPTFVGDVYMPGFTS